MRGEKEWTLKCTKLIILTHNWHEINCYDFIRPLIWFKTAVNSRNWNNETWNLDQAWKKKNYVVDMLFLELIPPEIDSLEIFHETPILKLS